MSNKKKIKHSPKPAPSSQNNEQAEMQLVTSGSAYSGPIPPPEILEHFERILPGAAKQIFSSFREESGHRQKMESREGLFSFFISFAGVISAFLLCLAAIGGGVYCVKNGHDAAGTIIGGTGLGSLVSVFIYGTRAGSISKGKPPSNQ